MGKACAVVIAIASVVVAAGCSPQVEHTAAEVVTLQKPQVTPGQHIPALGKPILTVIDGPHRLPFDLAGLEQLGTAESRVYEPYLKTDITFEGVPVAGLVTYLGLKPDDRILFAALDGFETTAAVGELLSSDAVIADHSGGREIPIADGGPIRLVFPGEPLASDLDQWIWSLKTLTIHRA